MASSLAWTLTGPFQPAAAGTNRRGDARQQPACAVHRLTPRSPTLDERALVEACLAGRRDAFDLIVERHRRAVYQLCYRFVGNHEDASDLSQDVFLRAYRGLRSFRGHSSLATWLYRIGVNVCLNRSARRRRSRPHRAD